MEGRSRFSRSSVRPRFCSQAVSRLLGLTVLEVLVMPPKVAGPGLSGKATLPSTIPPGPHPSLTDGGDGGHGEEEGAHELPASHAGSVAKDDVPIFVCLDDALGERL